MTLVFLALRQMRRATSELVLRAFGAPVAKRMPEFGQAAGEVCHLVQDRVNAVMHFFRAKVGSPKDRPKILLQGTNLECNLCVAHRLPKKAIGAAGLKPIVIELKPIEGAPVILVSLPLPLCPCRLRCAGYRCPRHPKRHRAAWSRGGQALNFGRAMGSMGSMPGLMHLLYHFDFRVPSVAVWHGVLKVMNRVCQGKANILKDHRQLVPGQGCPTLLTRWLFWRVNWQCLGLLWKLCLCDTDRHHRPHVINNACSRCLGAGQLMFFFAPSLLILEVRAAVL